MSLILELVWCLIIGVVGLMLAIFIVIVGISITVETVSEIRLLGWDGWKEKHFPSGDQDGVDIKITKPEETKYE